MDNERDNSLDNENAIPDSVECDNTSEDAIVSEETANTSLNDVNEPNEATDSEKEAEDQKESNTERPSGFNSALSMFYEYVEVFAVSIIAVILIFTFSIRLCQVDGNSMNNTLKNDELIIATNLFYEPKQGDIIVFHLVNESYKQPLVKRVIATEGQTVEINMKTGVIKVDGVVYEDEHAYLQGGKYSVMKDFDTRFYSQTTGCYAATVPEGHVFVLGDNRNNSNDSRMRSVGFVDVDTILGKAIIRLAPFSFLE